MNNNDNNITIVIIVINQRATFNKFYLYLFTTVAHRYHDNLFFSHDRSFVCFFMIFPGHRRKAIQAKFVNIGPLIMII